MGRRGNVVAALVGSSLWRWIAPLAADTANCAASAPPLSPASDYLAYPFLNQPETPFSLGVLSRIDIAGQRAHLVSVVHLRIDKLYTNVRADAKGGPVCPLLPREGDVAARGFPNVVDLIGWSEGDIHSSPICL